MVKVLPETEHRNTDLLYHPTDYLFLVGDELWDKFRRPLKGYENRDATVHQIKIDVLK